MRRSSGRAVVGAVLVLVGIAWLLESAGILDVSAPMLMAIALVIIGGALVATSSRGTSTGLLIAGIVLTVLLLVDGPGRHHQMNINARRSVRSYAPKRGTQIRPYRLDSGQLRIDLSGTKLSGTEEVEGHIDAGSILVTVPRGVPIKVDATIDVGSIWILGERRATGPEAAVEFESPDYEQDRPRINMDLEADAGTIRVVEAD